MKIDYLIIISIFFLINSTVIQLNSDISISYPTSKTLLNGNIFIIHETGVYVCDKSLSTIIKTSLSFSDDTKLTKNDLMKVRIGMLDDGILFCIIKDSVYAFDKEGAFLSNYNIILTYSGTPELYSLFGLTYDDYSYYYYVAYALNNKLYIQYYEYILDYKKTEITKSNYDGIKCCLQTESYTCQEKNIKDNIVNCHLMINPNDSKKKIITCFYIIMDDEGKEYFGIGRFDVDGGTFKRSSIKKQNIELNNIEAMKSVVSPDLTTAFICVIFNSGENNCFKYYYNQDLSLDFFNCGKQKICQTNDYSLNVNYFSEKNEYIFGCSGEDSNITTCIFNNDFSYTEKNTKFECKKEIDSFSYVYSSEIDGYNIILDNTCEEKNINLIDSTFLVKETLKVEQTTSYTSYEKCELKKCNRCDNNSILKNLCIDCNKIEGYYPLNIQNELEVYIDCYTNETKPDKFYFNEVSEQFEPCYKSCESCIRKGDDNNNNCIKCEEGYEKNEITNNCEIKCDKYHYYYFGEKRCTKEYKCPNEFPLLVNNSTKCTDNCKNEEIYNFQYNGECIKGCDEKNCVANGNICEDINKDKCILTKRKLMISNENNINDIMDHLEKAYTLEFNYTENHVVLFENDKFSVIFYKNESCISNLSLQYSEVNFNKCYTKVQSNYSLEKNLVIGLVYINNNKTINKNYPILDSLSMYEPDQGNKLKINDLCINDSIIVKENLVNKLKKENDKLFISPMLKQNIDVFNPKDNFYTDICYKYDSPTDRDISLKDRLKIFFPNITLCEKNCEIKGINSDTMKAECECKFNDIINNNLLSDNLFYKNQINEITEILGETNLVIIKCYKEFFKHKYILKSIGAYITIVIIVIQIISTIIFYLKSLYSIRKYVFDITEKYSSYLNSLNKINAPQRRTLKNNNKKKSIMQRNIKKQYKSNIIVVNNINNNHTSSLEKIILSNGIIKTSKDEKIMEKSTKSDKALLNRNLEEYIMTDLNSLDYEDALIRDKRKFFEYFFSKLKMNFIILDIFFNKSKFKPISIKILLLALNLDVYLVVNAFFYNEELISKIYNSENENKFSFISRTFDQFFYIMIVIFFYNNIIECFFISEDKIKHTIKRQKDNIRLMKVEVFQILIKATKNFTIFIIVSFVITIFSVYYISCFNNIYPKTKIEWIKSSFLSIFIFGGFIILIILLETILRFIGLCTKSEKVFKLSLILSEINNY